MLSVVVPTLNAAARLPDALIALVPAAIDGLVSEVVIADGGSTDATLAIADEMGARIVPAERGRGRQLAAGARAAKGPFLLFLHADTVLEAGWEAEAWRFVESEGAQARAAAFRFALDDLGADARRLERLVAWRCATFALPYGDQGLLIAKSFYERLGGFRALDLMEDVDLVRRIGRARLVLLEAKAVTSAERFRREGYLSRPLRNLSLLALYFLRVPPRLLARLYG